MEVVGQHCISVFQSCEIRNVQHRKQMPSIPTLMLEFRPDAPTERARKRRSSRTGGLTSKDPWASTLLFRTVPEERYNIYNWQSTIKPQLIPEFPDYQSELSPVSPVFSTFSNPFARDNASFSTSSRPEFLQRASSQNTSSNTYPHAPREKSSVMISPSPSLRSRRSDLSSQGSSLHPPMGFTSNHSKHYKTLPSDLPSPASTLGYDNQFIEGWTSAQGRSSTLSSHHTRGSNSIASAVTMNAPPIGTTPPGPRETILDRAFQMRCIPGSEKMQDKSEEKISSIAKFEALMRESDERRQQQQQQQQQTPAPSNEATGRGGWPLDEESDDSSQDDLEEDDAGDTLDMSDEEITVPTPAQRALDYISGRRTPLSPSRPLSHEAKDPPIPFLNPQAMSAFHASPASSSSGGLGPRTGTGSNRNSRPTSLALPSRSLSAATVPMSKEFHGSSSNGNLKTGDREAKDMKRRSSTSVKRLSFTEFARRLSSTSSLLLVQTNASSSSGRDGSRKTSSEYAIDDEKLIQKGPVNLRGGAGPTSPEIRDKRCGWRGSVGVFGSNEGGFL